MATTSSTLVAGEVARQGGSGSNGRYGLKAKMAASVAILGCAAALAFGGLRPGESVPAASLAAVGTGGQGDVGARQRFLEENLWLPTGTIAGPVTSREHRIFLEQNRQLPDGSATAPRLDWETIRLIEQNLLPEAAPTPGPGLVPPGPANFLGEDY